MSVTRRGGRICTPRCVRGVAQEAGVVLAAGVALVDSVVVDDVLDVEATSQDLGKTAGKDAQQGKPTYVSMLGLSAARQWAERLRQDAHGALDTLPAAAAARAVRLRQLADFIVLRKS